MVAGMVAGVDGFSLAAVAGASPPLAAVAGASPPLAAVAEASPHVHSGCIAGASLPLVPAVPPSALPDLVAEV